MDELKQWYNELLKRYKDGDAYMNNPNVPDDKKLMYVDELYKITERLEILLDSIGTYTEYEALNGFQIEKRRKTA